METLKITQVQLFILISSSTAHFVCKILHMQLDWNLVVLFLSLVTCMGDICVKFYGLKNTFNLCYVYVFLEILVRRIVFKNVFVHWNLAGRLSVLINLIHPSNYEVYCSLSQHHVWHVLILFFNVQPFTLISMSFLFKHAVFMFLLCIIKCSDFLGISLPCSWFSWFLSLIEMKQKSFFKHFLTPLSLRSDPDAMQ